MAPSASAISNRLKVFDNLTMLGMRIWMYPYHDTTSIIGQAFKDLWVPTPSYRLHPGYAAVEAVEPFKMQNGIHINAKHKESV
jgi:hypothetical protein